MDNIGGLSVFIGLLVPVPAAVSKEPALNGITGEDVAKGAGIVAGGYIVYRVVRMLPSLIPVLWPTIPANLAIP